MEIWTVDPPEDPETGPLPDPLSIPSEPIMVPEFPPIDINE